MPRVVVDGVLGDGAKPVVEPTTFQPAASNSDGICAANPVMPVWLNTYTGVCGTGSALGSLVGSLVGSFVGFFVGFLLGLSLGARSADVVGDSDSVGTIAVFVAPGPATSSDPVLVKQHVTGETERRQHPQHRKQRQQQRARLAVRPDANLVTAAASAPGGGSGVVMPAGSDLDAEAPGRAGALASGSQPAQALHEHGVERHRLWTVDQGVQHLVVAGGRHVEQVANGLLLGPRVLPPLPLEGQDRLLALGEDGRVMDGGAGAASIRGDSFGASWRVPDG